MKRLIIVSTVIFTFLLSSCSPHSGTGVWKSLAANEWGIERLVVGFEGKATFVSTNKDNATWHCFWTTQKDQEKGLSLTCTASTQVDKPQTFDLRVNEAGNAELRHDAVLLATFELLDENPSPPKK